MLLDKAFSKTCSKSDLTRELAEFRVTDSPLNTGFHFEYMLSEVNECRVVKKKQPAPGVSSSDH